MSDNLFFLLLGGLGFFFFGMKTMSEGLKNIAGERLRNFLHNVTKHPLIGICVGASVTALIQSSSATTVMVVGFVNAGLLVLKQAIYVIMGANIGTTFTAWLVSSMSVFKITSYSLPAVGIGFGLMSFCRKRRHQSLGQAILGFGLLFIGLHFMKEAFHPLRDNEQARQMLIAFSHNPWLGALVGALFTALINSSSASIAIVQMLAFNGVITFEGALPIILGSNIGTTITAQFASFTTNLNARRAAMSHTIFNVLGAVIWLVLISAGVLHQFIVWMGPRITAGNVMVYIAIAHSVFNVANTLIFLPFTQVLERVSIWAVPKRKDSIDFGTQYLERHLLDTPALALEQVHNETVYMLTVARKGVNHAYDYFVHKNPRKIKKVCELEDVTDGLQADITQYIVDLSKRELNTQQSQEIPVLIHNVNDIERIADHSQNLIELIRRIHESKAKLTETSREEIQTTWQFITDMFDDTIGALKANDQKEAQRVLAKEKQINQLQVQIKQKHAVRVCKGETSLSLDFNIVELIDNLEKIGDRLTNIAESVMIKMQWRTEKHLPDEDIKTANVA
jgi:phosphate:Na+ symporter